MDVHLLLLLLLTGHTSADKPGEPVDGAYLMLTQAITRHGDRAPESDPFITQAAYSEFFRGNGELTTEGAEHAQKIGEAYREIYVDSDFIDGRLDSKEVRFQSSSVNRVLMTGAFFSSGLFEDQGEKIMAPLYSVPYYEDRTLAVNYACTLGWEDVKLKYGLTNTTDVPNQLLAQMRQKEWRCETPPAYQSDTIISEYSNSKTKKQLTEDEKACARGPAVEFMFEYILQLGGSGTDDPLSRSRLQRTVSNLTTTVLQNFNQMIACYAYQPKEYCDPFNGKAYFYFSHDVNAIAFMNIISFQRGAREFFQGRTPHFGLTLVLELWVKRDEYYTKIFVKNGVKEPFIEFDFCRHYPKTPEYPRVGPYCSIQALKKATDAYIDPGEPPCMPPPPKSNNN